MHGLLVILKCHNLQSLDKALDLFKEFKFCESDFNSLNRSKNCMVATYNFGSVYTHTLVYVAMQVTLRHRLHVSYRTRIKVHMLNCI